MPTLNIEHLSHWLYEWNEIGLMMMRRRRGWRRIENDIGIGKMRSYEFGPSSQGIYYKITFAWNDIKASPPSLSIRHWLTGKMRQNENNESCCETLWQSLRMISQVCELWTQYKDMVTKGAFLAPWHSGAKTAAIVDFIMFRYGNA